MTPDVSETAVPAVTILRYDQDLFAVNPDRLQAELVQLQPSYPVFLDTDLSDTAALASMRAYLLNPGNIALHAAVDSVYPDLSGPESELTEAFRHFRYYFPGIPLPRVYSYISGGDFDYPVQFADSVMLIGLDNFLGTGYGLYAADGLPVYRRERMTREHIVPACMSVLGQSVWPGRLPGNSLVERMVEAGKRLVFIDAMLPSTPDRLKIGYTQSQVEWITSHEQHVWAAMIENRMLFSSDGRLIRTFMADGPFTADFSQESPPRLGEWIGWQIVREYFLRNSNVSLDDLMKEQNAQKILDGSGYKPGK